MKVGNEATGGRPSQCDGFPGKEVSQPVGTLGVARGRESEHAGGVTHINVGGIRYLPLAPSEAVREAVSEYQAKRLRPQCEVLSYMAAHPSVVFCRHDWENAIQVSAWAARDNRLTETSRLTFARISDVLCHALPWRPRDAATVL